MGYFPNGTSNEIYVENLCVYCVHHRTDEGMCPVMFAHLIHNYADCNKDDSILHLLIPRDADGWNDDCAMFHARDPDRCRDTPDMFGGE